MGRWAEPRLNHKPRGLEAVYNRHTYFVERRVALASLSNLILEVEKGGAVVVPIRGHKKVSKR